MDTENLITWALLIILLAAVLADRIKSASSPRSSKHGRVILDSCALIDGRVVDLINSGFVPEELIVPQFIINELQLLADGADAYKRERARFGLDIIKRLQEAKFAVVTVDRTKLEKYVKTDDALVSLAKKLGAALYTTDYNLQKVAEIEGVRVMNVNELAQNLRPIALPGEYKTVKIIQKGTNPNQGVGYLADGTMLVVDGAANLIGKTVEASISHVYQTVAGKMLFAELISSGGHSNHPAPPHNQKPQRSPRRSPKAPQHKPEPRNQTKSKERTDARSLLGLE